MRPQDVLLLISPRPQDVQLLADVAPARTYASQPIPWSVWVKERERIRRREEELFLLLELEEV